MGLTMHEASLPAGVALKVNRRGDDGTIDVYVDRTKVWREGHIVANGDGLTLYGWGLDGGICPPGEVA